MNNESHEKHLEMLAGFADGELGPHDREAIEAWLADHPEEQANLEAQRAFARKSTIWQRSVDAIPSDSTWNMCLLKIRAALQPATPSYITSETDRPYAPRRRSWHRAGLGMVLTATAIMIAIGVMTSAPNPDNPISAAEEMLVVASPDDLDIISVQGDDMILVGRPLLAGPLEIVTTGDVALDAIDSGLHGPSNPPNQVVTDPKRPMIITPSQPVP